VREWAAILAEEDGVVNRLLLAAAGLLLGCSGGSSPDAQSQDSRAGSDLAGKDVASDMLDVFPRDGAALEAADDLVVDVPVEADALPQPVAAGQDVDERKTRELASGYTLPDIFFSTLEEMGLPLSKLTFPDLGLTADWDTSRLHWTDTIRHAGHLAPVFAYMVIEDVEAACGAGDTDTAARELLVAQHTYMDTQQFVTSRYDRRYEVADFAHPLTDAIKYWYDRPAPPGAPAGSFTPFAELEPNLALYESQLPREAAAALAVAVRGLTDAADLRTEALLGSGKAGMDLWTKHYNNFIDSYSIYGKDVQTEVYPAIDYETMNRAGQLAVRSLESLRLALATVSPVDGFLLEIKGPYGTILIDFRDAGTMHVAPDGFLVVDLAGDDTYLGRVGTNGAAHLPLGALLDLSGNDTYLPSAGWEFAKETLMGPRAPSMGAGIYGIGILSDAGGDDTYRLARTGLGYGVFGVGVMMDHGGNDSYEGYENCMGSAELGYGLFVDFGQGNDTYKTLQYSLGYSGPRGIGWAVDQGGDDTYVAFKKPIIYDWAGEGTNFSGSLGFAFGWRMGPYWSGGLGGMFDLSGNDQYECAVMCIGFGYFFGTGLFYDKEGDDEYTLTHKYGIGAATHQSVGLFVDGSGKDGYANVGDDESIGLGYDHGVAFHIDRGAQDDHYEITNYGDYVFGFARHPSMGVLINEGGNDTYIVPGNGQRSLGRSEVDEGDRDVAGKGVVTLGMFLDMAGPQDVYTLEREECVNGATWRQTEPFGGDWVPELDFGIGLDLE
jgi:hypothetical protein